MVDDPEKRRASGASTYLVSASEKTRSERRHTAPSAERNLGPIANVLQIFLPERGKVLEIASGTGQHITAFGGMFPQIEWIPSDIDAVARESTSAWTEERGLTNIAEPHNLDVMQPHWQVNIGGPLDAILAINLIHITPWAATEGLMRGAGELLGGRGLLYVYGPYRRDGEHTAESNIQFEQWLKERNPEFGVRDVADVEREAEKNGLRLDDIIDMPANNFSLIFRKG